MSEEKKAVTADVEKAVKESAAPAQKAPHGAESTKFSLSHLAAYSYRLYGVSSSTFAGATADLDAEKTYTKEFVQNHISQWLEKGVK